MSAAQAPSFPLQPITEADIPDLTKVAGLAFETDRQMLLKAAHPTDPYDHAGGLSETTKH